MRKSFIFKAPDRNVYAIQVSPDIAYVPSLSSVWVGGSDKPLSVARRELTTGGPFWSQVSPNQIPNSWWLLELSEVGEKEWVEAILLLSSEY